MAALVLLLALPSAAMAKTGGGQSVMRFAFASHSGYRVRVQAGRSTVELEAARRSRSGEFETSTAYIARARRRGDVLAASFGGLGRVSMRFIPATGARQAKCEDGRRLLIRHGLFVGSLRFSGESDYLGVDVRRAKGAFVSGAGPRCQVTSGSRGGRPGGRPGRPRAKLTYLEAGFRAELDAVYFQAFRLGSKPALYTVFDEAGGERLAILRRAFAKASPLSFATDDALSFARVTPPFPFSGSGLVQRGPNGRRSWSGSLTVSFPGDPDVALTGSQFRTQLTRAW